MRTVTLEKLRYQLEVSGCGSPCGLDVEFLPDHLARQFTARLKAEFFERDCGRQVLETIEVPADIRDHLNLVLRDYRRRFLAWLPRRLAKLFRWLACFELRVTTRTIEKTVRLHRVCPHIHPGDSHRCARWLEFPLQVDSREEFLLSRGEAVAECREMARCALEAHEADPGAMHFLLGPTFDRFLQSMRRVKYALG